MDSSWKSIISLIGSFALLPGIRGASTIPRPTGPHGVGMKTIAIPYVTTDDPIAPNNVTTACLATVYYPTPDRFQGPAIPYLDPSLAALFEDAYNVTAGSFANLTTDAIIQNARFLGGTAYPTLIFGPAGVGPPVAMFSILLSDLASHGYTVIGHDHPYEQPFIRWPNGTALYGLPPFSDPDWFDAETFVRFRVNEAKAVIDNIDFIEQCLGNVVINSTHIGTFGHSVGGAEAAGALVHDERVGSAIDIDGSFWTVDQNTDAKKPVLLFSEAEIEDPSWIAFAPVQTGWFKHLRVTGSLHVDFTDETFWKQVTDVKAHSSSLGDIDGGRMVNITRTFVRSFFDFTLREVQEPIFDGPSDEWPEIVFATTENGTAQGE